MGLRILSVNIVYYRKQVTACDILNLFSISCGINIQRFYHKICQCLIAEH